MRNIQNIQPTVRTDIRNSKKQSHMRMILAGGGIAGALLISSLFGGTHGTQTKHTTARFQMHMVKVSAPISNSTEMKTAPLSYSMANDFVGMARQAAISAGISPDAFVRQIQQESGFNAGAGSPAGAVGIAQFMPGTAASMGVNPYDPSSALPGAARMMAGLASQFGGDYRKALAAYNAGAGAVNSAVAQGGGNWLSLMPTETQNYVATIMG
jgi:soluble lytic murein transglycosylase-like protein